MFKSTKWLVPLNDNEDVFVYAIVGVTEGVIEGVTVAVDVGVTLGVTDGVTDGVVVGIGVDDIVNNTLPAPTYVITYAYAP